MAVTFAMRFDSPKKAAIPAMSQMSSSSKPWDFQHIEICLAHGLGRVGDLDREVEHRLLALRDVGLSVVDRHLVRDQRVLGPDTQDRPVGYDAILALI